MRLSFRQIEAFREVVVAGSMTAAAAHLHLSQPAVSRLIAHLEAETGLRLFERRKRRIHVTHQGRMLFAEIEKAFVGLDKVAKRAIEIREFRTGSLKLAAMPALSFGLIPMVIRGFRERYPDVDIALQIRSSEKVFEWLSGQQFDLGLAALPSHQPVPEIEMIDSPPCLCIVQRTDPLAKRDVITPQDLRGRPFISLGPDSMLRKHIDTVFREAQVQRDMVLETPMSLSALQFAQLGLGTTIVDPFTARTFAKGTVVARPFEPRVPYEFGALFPPHTPRAEIATVFMDALCREIRTFGAPLNG
jgi:DNA-binding transcriptional LysR family regulator